MKINNFVNYNNSVNFGAIFELKKDEKSMSQIVTNVVCDSTTPEEAQKIREKFLIGGGSIYVYVPDENLQELLKRLSRTTNTQGIEYLKRVD